MKPSDHDDSQLPADNRLALRRVVRSCRKAALASLMEGQPYCSLVTVAVDSDLAPLLLLSGLSDHTRNLMADPRLSLLFDGTDGLDNPQTGPRVTVTGRAEQSLDPRLKQRFLAMHPGAALYADFADFSLWRVVPDRAHFVGGFGRAVWFDAPFGLTPGQVAAVAGIDLPATADGGAVIGLDPDGCDVIVGGRFHRQDFARAILDAEDAYAALRQVAANPQP